MRYEILHIIGERIRKEVRMTNRQETNLAFFLENLTISLAADLEWALARLDDGDYASDMDDDAMQYIKARSHLRTQKAYREACGKIA